MSRATAGGQAVNFENPVFPFTEARVAAARKAVQDGLLATDKSGRRSWRDADCRGLTLVVNEKTGTSVFYFVGKVDGKSVRDSIGDIETVRLQEARLTVNRKRYDRTAAAALAPRRSAVDDANQLPVLKAVMDAYLDAHAAGRWLPGSRSRRPTDRTMQNYADLRRATMSDKKTGEDFEQLTLQAFADRLPAIYATLQQRAPIQANRALQLWRNLFSYAADSGLWAKGNPAIGTGRTDRLTRTVEQPRQRVLADAEAKRLDAALDADLPLWRDLFRFSFLTLQRMGAVCRARWDDVTLTGKWACWRIPAEDMKGRKGGHTVPLVDIPEALKLLRARRAVVPKDCPWIFPAAEGDDGHARNYDKAWERIIHRANLWSNDRSRRPRPHDLRRSGGSRMVEAGIPLNTVTAALGNAPSSTPMVARTYAVVTDAAVKDAFAAVSRRGSRRR
jgi:integrase